MAKLKSLKPTKVVKKGKKEKKLKTEAQIKRRQERLARKAAGPAAKPPLLTNRPPTNPSSSGIDESVDPSNTAAPIRKQATHAKWAVIFKRHLGLIESHIKSLDRITQSMKSRMRDMEPEERGMWERGEVGNWPATCAMVERAKQMLADAKEARQTIAPENEKKGGLGIMTSKSGSGEPQSTQHTQPLGATVGKSTSGDNESTDSDEEEDSAPADFIPLNVTKKKSEMKADVTRDQDGDTEMSDAEDVVEPNPYFVVDTEPTPVNLTAHGKAKKTKKQAKEDGSDDTNTKKVKKSKKSQTTAIASESGASRVDFKSVEASLKAEVEAGLKAKQELEEEKARTKDSEKALGKKEKKRKRLSAGDGDAEKEVKKVKKDKSKKRTADESSGGEEVVDGSKKKKRKHKADA